MFFKKKIRISYFSSKILQPSHSSIEENFPEGFFSLLSLFLDIIVDSKLWGIYLKFFILSIASFVALFKLK